MDTINKAVKGLNYLEGSGADLLQLLEGVSTHASKDKAMHSLNSVQIEGAGGLLIARATDRYRLIEGSIRTLDGGQLDPALIALDDVKRMVTLLKTHKAHNIGLSRIGNALTISALGDAITFTLLDASFPAFSDLFTKSEGDPVPAESLVFNPALMADYAKIAGKGAGVKFIFTGDAKPVRVNISGDRIVWRALLMPMRDKN